MHTVTRKCTTRQHHLSLSFFNLSHFTIHSFTQYRTGTTRNPQVTKSLLSFSQPSKFQQIASQNRNNHLFPRPPWDPDFRQQQRRLSSDQSPVSTSHRKLFHLSRFTFCKFRIYSNLFVKLQTCPDVHVPCVTENFDFLMGMWNGFLIENDSVNGSHWLLELWFFDGLWLCEWVFHRKQEGRIRGNKSNILPVLNSREEQEATRKREGRKLYMKRREEFYFFSSLCLLRFCLRSEKCWFCFKCKKKNVAVDRNYG